MNSPPVQSPRRFVGLDVHKSYLMVAAVDAAQNIVLQPRRVSLNDLESWARQQLKASDEVVLEATTNAWHVYDQLQPFVASVTVAHPLSVKSMGSKRVKTDARDTITLARLLSAGLIVPVWVPPKEVVELRALVSHRRRLVNQRTQVRNRLHGVLHRNNLVPPAGNCFSSANRDWWEGLRLASSEKLLVRQNLLLLDALEPLIEEGEEEVKGLSTQEPWVSQVPFLVQLPGVGVLSAMVLLSAIGDISRFPAAKKLVGYSGLGASVHDSGQTHRGGRITKEGRREIRGAVVESAWIAVESSPRWKKQFERLAARIGRKKAIVAIARKLLVVVWHVLTERVADRHGEVEKVAVKLMNWFFNLGEEARQGMTSTVFARRQLIVLGVGESLERVNRYGQVYRLPPLEGVKETAVELHTV